MRKHILLSLSLLTIAATAFASDKGNKATCDDVWGHTFFAVRSPFQTAMPEKETMFRDRAGARCDGKDGAIQIVGFGGRSTKSKDLGRYFSPRPKDELVVDSDPGTGNPSTFALLRDINPVHFGIEYTAGGQTPRFKSTIQFRPRQQFYGVGFTYRQYLNRCGCERTWWLELSTPLVHIKNDMGLEEKIDIAENDPGDGPANMVEAFTGKKFLSNGNALSGEDLPQYGLIDCAQKETRLADIELKLGRDWIDECECHLDTYFGIVIPTGNKPKAKYVFEPIVGNNFHFGFLLGTAFGGMIWEGCDKSLSLELAVDSRFFISNTQRRSFDLKDRRWSRYMLIYKNEDAVNNLAATPGINEFTKKVRVQKRYQVNMNTGLVYDSCNFRSEVGVNFWARQAERIKLKEAWQEGVAVIAEPGDVTVNLINNIANDAVASGTAYETTGAERTVVRAEDLDLCSAAHPAAMSWTPYLSLGYHWDNCCYPTFVGLGGSYEISGKNTALNRWTVWGKFGFSL